MKFSYFGLLINLFLVSTTIFISPNRSYAADAVVLKYSILRETVSVPELSHFAETGELSQSLKSYLNMANKNPDDLRGVLTKPIPVDPIFLYKFLNSYPGEKFLDWVSEIVMTPSERASRESLRAALVASALADNNITLIEVFENYPTPEVHVDGNRLAEMYSNIRKMVEPLTGFWQL